MAEQRIQIKRRNSKPSSEDAWKGLLDGELAYIKEDNKLYIGNGLGETPTLISTLSWDELTGKPTSILSQIYLNSTDPTKIVYKKVGSNTEHALGNFAPLTNGLIDLKYLPQGALERLVVVANATARLKLTTANVQLGDTVKETDTGLMYVVVDESKLNSEDGYQVYVAGRAAAIDWTGVENKVNATSSSAGLMSAADKKKLDNTNVAYGTCTTAADVAAKVITISGNTNWKLVAGSMISIFFSYTNTAQNPTFNVNGTGAKNVYFNQSQITTSNLRYGGYTNRICNYIYDGTQFRFHSWGYDTDTNTQVRVYRNSTSSYDKDYPLIASRTLAADLGTVGTQDSNEAVYGLISDTAANIPTINPYSGAVKVKSLSATGNISTSDGNVSGKLLQTTAATNLNAVSDKVAVIKTGGQINYRTPAQIISDAGVTATVDELNYVDGVTSNLQTQLDNKYDKTGGPINGNVSISGTTTLTGAVTAQSTLTINGASQLLNGLKILGSTNADSILPNITDTYSLGSSEKRWNNLYVKTSNIYQLTVDNLSANTGYFANNLGVGGTNTAYKLYVNGLVKVGNGASATSASTGGLQVNGGIGVSGPSYFNNSITVANNILPEANNTRLLGSSTNYWKEAYISKMYGSADKVDGYHFDEAPYIKSVSFSQPEANKIWYLKISTEDWNRRSETIYITTAGNNRGGTIILKTGARHSRWFGWATTYNGTGVVGVKKVTGEAPDNVFIKMDAETTSVTIRTTFVSTVVSTTDTEGYTTVPSSGGFFGNQIQASLEGNADSATVLKNARTLTIGKTGKTFNGSANVSWTLAEIGAVAKAGDTMTGFLTLHANPTANLHAATKQYVDATVENAAKLFTVTTTITTDTASSVVFDTSTVTLSTCLIYYNGLLMTPGVNYSITNNTTIALSGWTANKGDIFTVSGKQADEVSVIAAGKLNCGTVGSATLPVYFNNGIPVECDTLNYAKLESPNNLLHSTNEFTFAKAGYSGDIYINYRTDGMSTSGNIGEYKFCKGDGAGSLANIRANTFHGALSGNASTATKLATARTITLDGDVKGSASFDGSGNITITTEAGASGISYVDGSGSTTAGTWIGTNTEISGLYTGLTIAYKIGVAGASTTTLNLTTAAGASGAKTVKRNAGNLTTHLPVGTVVLLTYDGTNWCWADYSTSDTKNTAGTTNSTSILYLAGATSQAANPQTYSHSAIKANCNSSGTNEAGSLTATKVYGAVWNDYAEYRDQIDVIEPGYCVASTDDGKVYKTIENFQACDGIVSDTFGFSIGETDNCKTPLAVAGRVLAYCEGDRNSYHAGDTVCASLNGKVMKMTREEIKEYPDRIVGVVSEIPTYEYWGSGNVKVNNRIWIKVK